MNSVRPSDGPNSLAIILLSIIWATLPGCQDKEEASVGNVLGTKESILKRESILKSQPSPDDPASAKTQPSALANGPDLSFLSGRHQMAAVLNGKQLCDYFSGRNLDIDQQLLPADTKGVSLSDLKFVTMAVDQEITQKFQSSMMSMGASAGKGLTKGWVVQIEFDKDVNQAAWATWILGEKPIFETINDQSIAVSKPRGYGITWVSPQKARIGPKDELVLTKAAGGGQSSLTDRLLAPPKDNLVFAVVDASPLRDGIKKMADMAMSFYPSMVKEYQNEINASQGLERIELAMSVSSDDLGYAKLELSEESEAKTILSFLNRSLDSWSKNANRKIAAVETEQIAAAEKKAGNSAGLTVEIQKLISQVQKELANGGTTASREGKAAILEFQRPQRMDDLLDSFVVSWKESQKRNQPVERLVKIHQAIIKYTEVNGTLPQASNRLGEDKTEKGHSFSWRVTLLPMLGQKALYDQFDFSQPWDSPSNLKIATKMPEVFKSFTPEPADSQAARHRIPTSEFSLLTGKHGAFGENPVKHFDDISDGLDKTLIVVEHTQNLQPWTKPGGFPVDEASHLAAWMQDDTRPMMGLLASGRVVSIDHAVDVQRLLRWVTPAGKERMNRKTLHRSTLFAPVNKN